MPTPTDDATKPGIIHPLDVPAPEADTLLTVAPDADTIKAPVGEGFTTLEPTSQEEVDTFELLDAGFVISSEDSPLHETTHLTPAQLALYTKG